MSTSRSVTSVEIVIPAFNEAAIIAETIARLNAVLSQIPQISFEIIVADNGSTDGTADVVRASAISGARVLRVPLKGKGNAILSAALSSQADVFGFVDADLSADPEAIPDLVRRIIVGADIAVGSRLLDSSHVDRGALRTLSSKIFNMVRWMIVGINVSDSQCGLKFFGPRGVREILSCSEQTWFLDVEILARAERAGLSIVEVPVGWAEFRYKGRRSKLRVFRDGFSSLFAMVRIRRKIRRS